MNEEKEFCAGGNTDNNLQESQPNFIMQENIEHKEEEQVVESQPNFVMQENTEQTVESQSNFVMQDSVETENQTNYQPNVVLGGGQSEVLSHNTSMAGTNTTNQVSNRPTQPQNYEQYNFWQQQSGGMGQQQMGGNSTTQQNYFNGMNNNYQPYNAQQSKLPKKKDYSVLKKVGKGLLAGVAAGAGFCVIVFGANKLGIVDTTTATETTKQANSLASTIVTSNNSVDAPNDLTSVVDKCMPSIVSINSTVTSTYNSFFGSYDQDSTGSGSGIVLKISDDEILIATNNHVIADAKKIVVGFNGTESDEDMIEAVVKGTDSTHDLAVVVVKTKNVPEKIMKNIAAADLGDSESAKVGEMAIAIGNSLGYGQSLTVGYISAKDRKVEVEEGTMNLLQTDAAINPGNSGGALLNPEGEVIGINSAKYSDTAVEGMGFAIPISEAIPIINDLMEREVLTEEEKGYLGISCTNITADSQYANMPQGVYVSEVSPDGAAYEAGIVAGDIIIGVDDLDITTSEELSERINSYRIGTKVTIKVMRYSKGEYEKKKIEVTLKGKESLESITEPEEQAGTNQNGSAGNGQQNPGQDSQGEDNQEQQNPYGNQIDPYGNGGYSDEEMEEFYRYFYGQ